MEGNEELIEGNEGAATEVASKEDASGGSFNRDEFVSDTFSEGMEEAVLEQLAGKEDITLDDLRKIPGAEGLSDEQLTAAWDAAQKEAGGEKPGEGADTKVELPFPVYDAQGNKIAADKVTLGDLLSGKALIGYNAVGKEQRKALNEVIRNASQGHWNEHRYNTVQSQYREASGQLTKLQKEVQQYEEQRSEWNSALTALVMGDNTKMKAIIEAYKGALGKTSFTPEGFVPQDVVKAEAEANQRGMEWYQEVGMPAAIDIAERYGANAKEVIGAIKYFIENEPVLTPQRIDEILKFDVPMAFEQNGYTAKDGSSSTPSASGSASDTGSTDKVAELTKQVEALTARLAGKENDKTNELRAKGKRTPPAGSGATGGAGDSMPAFKSREQMKEWLRQ